jgi:hypothetical protein
MDLPQRQRNPKPKQPKSNINQIMLTRKPRAVHRKAAKQLRVPNKKGR